MTSPDRWLRSFGRAAHGSPRLVCFPHAGGAASSFVPLARTLTPGVEVLAAQYPGRQDRSREPCVTDLGELADALTAAVRQRPGGWTVLFGHSMGAILAFEVARRLAGGPGMAPAAVVVSGRQAPSCRHGGEPWDDDDLERELRRLGGTDASVLADDQMREMALQVLRADAQAVASYRPDPDATIGCPLTAFTGDADPTTSVADARAWQRHTTGGFELRVFPGDHFYLRGRLAEVAGALGAIAAGGSAVG